MERTDLEQCLADLRKKVVKGAKPTRQRRVRGFLKALQGGVAASGQSRTSANPAPKVVRRKEDQPVAEETVMSLSDAVGRFRGMSEGKAAKKPGDPGTDKAQSKINKAAWAKMSPEQKKKYTGDTPMPSHQEDLDEEINFDDVPVKSIATELAEEQSSNDERDLAFAKSMLLDRVGLHESVRRQLRDEHEEQEEADPRRLPRGFADNLTGKVQAEAVAAPAPAKTGIRNAYPGPQIPDQGAPMSTGAFVSEDAPAPAAPATPKRKRRPAATADQAAAQEEMANFDPTKIRYPKELIGR